MTSLPDLRSIATSKLNLESAKNLAEQYKLYIPKNADLEFIRSTLRLIKNNFNDLPNYQKERERAIQYILSAVKLSDDLKDQFPDLCILEKTLRQNFRLKDTGEDSRPSTPFKLVTPTTSNSEFVFPEGNLKLSTETKNLSSSTPNLLSPSIKTPEIVLAGISKQDTQIQVSEPEKFHPEIIKQHDQIQ